MVSIVIGENSKKKCKSLQALPLQAHIKQLCLSGIHKKIHHCKNNHLAAATKHDRIIIIVSL